MKKNPESDFGKPYEPEHPKDLRVIKVEITPAEEVHMEKSARERGFRNIGDLLKWAVKTVEAQETLGPTKGNIPPVLPPDDPRGN